MHTHDGPKGTRFHHDSDALTSPNSVVIIDWPGCPPNMAVSVPAADIISFVCALVRQERLRDVEDLSEAALLGLRKR